MGALYHLKQKLVDFCNVIQENVSRTDTVPSSKVVYDLKADSDSQISDLLDHPWTTAQFTGNLDESVIPTKTGLYLCFIAASPSSKSVESIVEIRYSSSLVIHQSCGGDGTAYSGISAVGIVLAQDTTTPIRFIATNTASQSNYSIYGFMYIGNGDRLYPQSNS